MLASAFTVNTKKHRKKTISANEEVSTGKINQADKNIYKHSLAYTENMIALYTSSEPW